MVYFRGFVTSLSVFRHFVMISFSSDRITAVYHQKRYTLKKPSKSKATLPTVLATLLFDS